MKRTLPVTRTLGALLAVATILSASTAAAQTVGRISVANDLDSLTNPQALIDALILRLFLTSDHLYGKDLKLVVDMRSDIPLIASTNVQYGTSQGLNGVAIKYTTPFNGFCDGDDYSSRTLCQDRAVRDETLGQLSELAGIYDLYVQVGQSGEGKTTYSIGRKTIYEAGLVTVDGLTVEHTLNQEMRIGGFAGFAPDPTTRMFTPLYQTLGGYFAYTKMGTWVRVGADALNYQASDAGHFDTASNTPSPVNSNGPLAEATIFNQNFFLVSKAFTIGTYLDLDPIPGVDRLEYVDLTYKPSGRYSIRLNLTRFRPIEFDKSPELLAGGVVDPTVVSAYLTTTTAGGVNNGGPFRSRDPEIAPLSLREAPIELAKLSMHYVTAKSFTPYASLEFRLRSIDNESEILADLGVYTYDPYDTGIVARARLEAQDGFDASGVRLGGNIEREVTDRVTAGGGFDLAYYSYSQPSGDQGINSNYATGDTDVSLFGTIRYDGTGGFSVFAEAYYFLETASFPSSLPGSQSGDAGSGILAPLPKTTTDISILLGANFRFGGPSR